ncbi:Ferritin heavy polypeptide-like 17 [Cichlidogyrus casuarinus]|uniref:Ferritin n=1 Tax=Cichlidogyrus casuarinus TaxID=1844966 RepID=A0ABD2PXH7_9PLAT
MSLVRQKFHEECEAAINRQINNELTTAYLYMALSAHFKDVQSHTFAYRAFREASHEKFQHAETLIDYQNRRGGRVLFHNISSCPDVPPDASIQQGLELALGHQKRMNTSLQQLHAIADKHGDNQMTDFIETDYLDRQVKTIKNLGDKLQNSQRVSTGLGEYLFDEISFRKDRLN